MSQFVTLLFFIPLICHQLKEIMDIGQQKSKKALWLYKQTLGITKKQGLFKTSQSNKTRNDDAASYCVTANIEQGKR